MGVSGRDSIQGLEIRRLQVFEQSYREREGEKEGKWEGKREGGREAGRGRKKEGCEGGGDVREERNGGRGRER